MIEHVKRFFEGRWDQKSPFLLGYSGGPDSKALLYAMRKNSYPLHVAHVDHGWRKESREEALEIAKEMKTLGIPFHQVRLEIQEKGSQEAVAREARLSFFRSLFAKIPFQALLLAHQATDVAETCLKRIFEGAHLPFLGGMQEVSAMEEMPVWRPLLTVQKKEILLFLQELSLTPFFDPTNVDPKYLRSRLREEMFPYLRDCFGKSFEDNLRLLSERSYELQKYLSDKTSHAIIKVFPEGRAVCLKEFEKIEQRHLLQIEGRRLRVVWTRDLLEQILDWVRDPLVMRQAQISSHWIAAGRGWVVFLRERPGVGFLRSVID